MLVIKHAMYMYVINKKREGISDKILCADIIAALVYL